MLSSILSRLELIQSQIKISLEHRGVFRLNQEFCRHAGVVYLSVFVIWEQWYPPKSQLQPPACPVPRTSSLLKWWQVSLVREPLTTCFNCRCWVQARWLHVLSTLFQSTCQKVVKSQNWNKMMSMLLYEKVSFWYLWHHICILWCRHQGIKASGSYLRAQFKRQACLGEKMAEEIVKDPELWSS